MEERELVTLAFGNYSTLVAAQWANGTSHYDTHHATLYREQSSDCIRGGNSNNNNARVGRVPRLLMLDAPHGAVMKELCEAVDEMENDPHAQQQQQEGAGEDDVSSLLFGPRKPNLSAEEAQIAKVVQHSQRRWWEQTGEEDDEDDEGADCPDGSDSDREDDFYYYRPRQSHGIELPQPSSGRYVSSKHEDPHQQHQEEEEGEQEGVHGEEDTHKMTAAEKAKVKKRLFRQKDSVVPWWRYITTGLDAESITTLRAPQLVDASGDIAAMHCFGYGLSHFKPDMSSECDGFVDAMRRQLENADRLQGVQCFVESDSMFGGVAHNVLEELWEDAGSKVPVSIFSLYTPLPDALTSPEQRADIPFAARRVDEVKLNRLLSTSYLSAHTSALYVPIDIAQWPQLFGAAAAAASSDGRGGGGDASSQSSRCWWLNDDTAVAQYIAAMADTALYGVRDGGSPSAVAPAEGAVGESKGPAYYLGELCRTLRPAPSMRITSMLGVMPMRLHDARRQRNDLWNFLEATPLMPTTSSQKSEAGCFVPLSHAMKHSAVTEAGRVMGHAVSLRGAGVLPSAVYPAQEAMLRYALPLRTNTYLPLLTRTNYPLSRTFPTRLLFDNEEDMTRMQAQLPSGADLAEVLASTDVGTHLVNTSNAAPMLAQIAREAQSALRYKEHIYSMSYGYEKDDWRERMEDVLEVHDDYRREDEPEEEGDDDYSEY